MTPTSPSLDRLPLASTLRSVLRCRGSGFDHGHAGADEHPEFSGCLGDRCDPAKPVAVGPGVVSQHDRIPSIDFVPAEPQDGRAALNPAGSAMSTG